MVPDRSPSRDPIAAVRSSLRMARAGRAAPSAADALRSPHGRALTRRFAESLARDDRAGFAVAATALVGLGAGLTPAGDDCVVGALAVIHRVGHSLVADADVARRLRDAAWTRTTDVGREFLLHAIDGAFAESVLDAVSGEEARAARGLLALMAQGASSGADTWHGLRLAARALGQRAAAGGVVRGQATGGTSHPGGA
jgi:hypothetical protein